MKVIEHIYDVGDLFHPVGGIQSQTTVIRPRGDEPRFVTRNVLLRSELPRWPVRPEARRQPQSMGITGSGTGLEEKEAEGPAFGEALERLCSASYSDDQFITASADELGGDALDLDSIPRCSNREFAHPACPLILPRKDQPIRWVRAISLLDGRSVFVPVVMTFLYVRYLHAAERIWFPISTGCAAHTGLAKALLSGILEVVERDAISILWLQRLSLPRIEIDEIPPRLAPYWSALERGAKTIQCLFFDATTDVGFPTVYGLQMCPDTPNAATLVSCSTALDPAEAVSKVIRDMAHIRVAFRTRRSIPDNWDDFTDIFDGATFMSRAEQAHAFGFLLQSTQPRLLSEMMKGGNLHNGSDQERLAAVVERLSRMRLNTYVVELSTDEALRAGIRVVRVIIPGLQPLSFHYRARFLAHPRLYECPKAMGYQVHDEDNLNHWPQPFA